MARFTPTEPPPKAPAPPRGPAGLSVYDPTALDADYPDIDGVELNSGDVVDFPAAHSLAILRSRVVGTRLDVPADAVVEIQDATLTDVDLTARRIESAVRVRFTRCRLGGVDFGAARLRDVVFEDCLLDMASWRSASAERIEIRGGRMDGADLGSCSITDAVVAGVGFSEVVLDQSRLTRVDVRGADLTEVMDPTVLRGATITDVQAVILAARLARAAGLWISAD